MTQPKSKIALNRFRAASTLIRQHTIAGPRPSANELKNNTLAALNEPGFEHKAGNLVLNKTQSMATTHSEGYSSSKLRYRPGQRLPKEVLDKVIEAFSFEDAINFLQDRIQVNLQERLQVEEDQAKVGNLHTKIRQKVNSLKLENKVIRNKNFVLSKKSKKLEKIQKNCEKNQEMLSEKKADLLAQIEEMSVEIEELQRILGGDAELLFKGRKMDEDLRDFGNNKKVKFEDFGKSQAPSATTADFTTLPRTQTVSNLRLTESRIEMDKQVFKKMKKVLNRNKKEGGIMESIPSSSKPTDRSKRSSSSKRSQKRGRMAQRGGDGKSGQIIHEMDEEEEPTDIFQERREAATQVKFQEKEIELDFDEKIEKGAGEDLGAKKKSMLDGVYKDVQKLEELTIRNFKVEEKESRSPENRISGDDDLYNFRFHLDYRS